MFIFGIGLRIALGSAGCGLKKAADITPAALNFAGIGQSALKSGQVEAVKIHHLGPRRYKVLHELLPGVLTSVDFS